MPYLPGSIRKALAYMETHYRDVSLDDLAAVAGISQSHFRALFKQRVGITPHQYVITQKMREAKRLLQKTRIPLAEVAIEVGYCDQSYFTKLFHEQVGITPLAYREDSLRTDHFCHGILIRMVRRKRKNLRGPHALRWFPKVIAERIVDSGDHDGTVGNPLGKV